ncbi:ABC transporter substrate-binding protein [Nocardioides pacificus]
MRPLDSTSRLTRLLAGASAAVLVAGLAAGCSSEEDAAAGDVVKVGTLRGQPHFYAPYLYEDHASGDVTYEVVALDTAPALSDALVSGQIDFAVGSITATIGSDAQGRDLKVVAGAADGGSGFVGNDSIGEIGDLVGKKLGYLASSSQEVALRLTLEEAGVDIEQIDLVSLKATEFFGAFDSGQIDAFFAPEIAVSLALAKGGHEIASPYDTPIAKVNLGLITTGEMIEKDADLVQEVVDTHAAATDYMVENQDEWLPELVETYGGDQATFEVALDNFWLRADLSEEYQTQIQALIDQLERLGLVEDAPAIDAVVDDSFAPEAS